MVFFGVIAGICVYKSAKTARGVKRSEPSRETQWSGAARVESDNVSARITFDEQKRLSATAFGIKFER